MPHKPDSTQIEQVARLEVPFSVVLAEKGFSLEKLLELRPGAVLEFSRRHDEPLEAHVSGSRVGRGRAVDIGERLGFRLDAVDPPSAGAAGAGAAGPGAAGGAAV